MIRDYKFQRTEWTLRKKKQRFNARILLRLVLLIAIGGAAYGAYEWLMPLQDKKATTNEARDQGHSQIIPLQLPPSPGTTIRPTQ